MADMIQVACDNLGISTDVPMGTSLLELQHKLGLQGEQPFLAAYVNNRIKELNYKIYTPVTIRYVDITSYAGIRVYQRTVLFILQKAVADLYPNQKLHVRHSMGTSGFYCELEGLDEFTPEQTITLQHHMEEVIRKNYPITRQIMLTSEVRERYAAKGFFDKITLLDTRPRLYSNLYTLNDSIGYFYGPLTPSTGCITLFSVVPAYNGFCLALPWRNDPRKLDTQIGQRKMFDIFREYQSWIDILDVPTVGKLNAKVLAGDASELIRTAEAFHEKKLGSIADQIYAGHRARLVLISGPSSSGKTTFAKRLGVQLRVLGLQPALISLDDYFVDREKTPLDENGGYDYEALEAINLKLFNDHLHRLAHGESVEIPRYNFITGRSEWHETPLTLNERSILIVEGIHALNPNLTPAVPEHLKFKIYISCFTSMAMDNLARIATTDNRLLRRLTRDYTARGYNALSTLSRWPSVRRGEEKYIFPYQENADVMFNSSLFYEISVLRHFAEPILREVPNTVPEYDEAKRLLKFLDHFSPIAPDEIPPTSILREFIGGSSFKY